MRTTVVVRAMRTCPRTNNAGQGGPSYRETEFSPSGSGLYLGYFVSDVDIEIVVNTKISMDVDNLFLLGILLSLNNSA